MFGPYTIHAIALQRGLPQRSWWQFLVKCADRGLHEVGVVLSIDSLEGLDRHPDKPAGLSLTSLPPHPGLDKLPGPHSAFRFPSLFLLSRVPALAVSAVVERPAEPDHFSIDLQAVHGAA